jgi:hypothetical protein
MVNAMAPAPTDSCISDSKSSSGTQFSSSRPYINGQHGSTSTLPSSTDTGSDDNLFANVPRPQLPQHSSSSPGSYFGLKKSLPALPKTSSGAPPKDNTMVFGKRDRAMTASSYASTAIPPKLDSDLNFGESSFDDMFSGISRKESPEHTREPAGRSLLAEKRTFHAEPIKIHSELDVEPALASWDSRNSADNLMASPLSDDDSPPPPPPPHKYSKYAPLALDSPGLHQPASFSVPAVPAVPAPHKPSMTNKEKSYRESSPEPATTTSVSSSSANSFQTPLSSRSASTTATPKAALPPAAVAYNNDDDDDDDNLFAPPQSKPAVKSQPPAPKPKAPAVKPLAGDAAGSRVMTQAEFREYQKRQMSHPPADDSSEDEDYEDEEEAIRMREEQEVLRRKNQQMHFAREAMRRSTTAPGSLARPESLADNLGQGFPSETSMKADEWEDEDIPLGILAQHGFPSQTRNRFPSQPTNNIPSYFPDRPSSAGPATNRASHANLPAFARNLPADPHTSFIGGGLVQHANRESLGFNNFPRGPASVAGDAMGGGMGMAGPPPLMYQDAGMSQPSLVDQIQMRDMTKKKYMGGGSNKKPPPQEGPFTGLLGSQMNNNGQVQNQPRMSMMNPMMGMGGQMPMMGMGMGQMGYGMPQQNDYMQMQQFQQMQQMYAMQQMQFQMQQMQQQQPQDPRMSMAQDPRMSMAQDPRMSMAFGGNNMGGGSMMGGGSFLNVPGMQNTQNRPMSYMSMGANQQRPYSSAMGPGAGYTPSIAPSERSNVGLSARYRPVANQSDAISNGTSMTLQATSGGANQNKNGAIKSILKKGTQPSVPESADDEDWGMMAARKKKFAGAGKENNSSGLEDLTRGLNI